MRSDVVPVSVEILDKEYMVSCPEEERESLIDSARLLNERMRQVRDSGKVYGLERMAVITALNLVHELNRQQRVHESQIDNTAEEVRRLAEKVRAAIGRPGTAGGVD